MGAACCVMDHELAISALLAGPLLAFVQADRIIFRQLPALKILFNQLDQRINMAGLCIQCRDVGKRLTASLLEVPPVFHIDFLAHYLPVPLWP